MHKVDHLTEKQIIMIQALEFMQANMDDIDPDDVKHMLKTEEYEPSDKDKLVVLMDDIISEIYNKKPQAQDKPSKYGADFFVKKREKKIKTSSKKIDNQSFALKWIESETIQEVAEHFKTTVACIYQKVNELKSLGIQVPALKDEAVLH